MTTYRTAIIGLSWIATDPPPAAADPVLGTSIPYSHAAALAAVPNIDVVAGCDIVPALRDEFLERWSCRWPTAKVYDDYRELLAAERPEIVSIVTPDFLHADPVIAAIEAGARGIFCDKPLATTLEDADRIVAAARRAGVVMNINYTRRWIPHYVEARAQVRAGRIGKLSQIILETGGERAMLFRNHSHLIDLMCYYAESEPDWVFAELEAGFESYGTVYRGDGGKTTGSEPAANYYVAFENGVRAYLTGMKDTPADTIITLRGDKGRLVVDEVGVRLEAMEGGALRRTEHVLPAWTVAGMEAAVRDLLVGLETGRPVASPPEDARQSAAITQAILESQSRGSVPVPVACPRQDD